MGLREDIRPVSFLKGHTADLLAQVNETHRPVVITQNGEPRAVLQDTKSYERMRRAIGMLKLLAQGEEDLRSGKTIAQSDVFRQAKKRLKARERGNGKDAKV